MCVCRLDRAWRNYVLRVHGYAALSTFRLLTANFKSQMGRLSVRQFETDRRSEGLTWSRDENFTMVDMSSVPKFAHMLRGMRFASYALILPADDYRRSRAVPYLLRNGQCRQWDVGAEVRLVGTGATGPYRQASALPRTATGSRSVSHSWGPTIQCVMEVGASETSSTSPT